MIYYDPVVCEDLSSAIEKAIRMSGIAREVVKMEFNGVLLEVRHDSTVEALWSRYQALLGAEKTISDLSAQNRRLQDENDSLSRQANAHEKMAFDITARGLRDYLNTLDLGGEKTT